MKKKRSRVIVRLAFAALVLVTVNDQLSTCFSQGTAFTYQGRLNEGGNPANGLYDLQLGLYDAVSGGTQQGGLVTAMATGVSNGLFTVVLDFGSQFPGAARWLEIGVRTNGGVGFTMLAPRQLLSAMPYAITAGTVTGPLSGSAIVAGTIGSAQLGAGAVTAANIASNSITANQLAAGAAAANLGASGQAGVASGGLVLSADSNNTALAAAGYVKIGGTVTVNDVWLAGDTAGAPGARRDHTAVWTGSEMIVWGGQNNGTPFNNGGLYNPAANSWSAITITGAPAARYYHTAVWTGSQMIVWGGFAFSYLNSGGLYNPAANSWSEVATNGAPAARHAHTTVWTGNQMIVWGGWRSPSLLNDGGLYNPAANSWSEITTNGAPAARRDHTAVWTGNLMVIWGGTFNDGGLYDAAANSWSVVTTNGAPTALSDHTAVWTGSRMIVWGRFYSGGYLNSGGLYSPVANSWNAVATNGAPGVRTGHKAVWTGSQMIVWGGQNGATPFNPLLNDGGLYNPTANRWSAVTTNGAPVARSGHTAVWAGSQMIVYGGFGGGHLNDVALYTPGQVMFLYQKP